jgi:hypothetical protein
VQRGGAQKTAKRDIENFQYLTINAIFFQSFVKLAIAARWHIGVMSIEEKKIQEKKLLFS